jgi:hypothetical protein
VEHRESTGHLVLLDCDIEGAAMGRCVAGLVRVEHGLLKFGSVISCVTNVFYDSGTYETVY